MEFLSSDGALLAPYILLAVLLLVAWAMSRMNLESSDGLTGSACSALNDHEFIITLLRPGVR